MLVASTGLIGYKRAECVHREPDPATTGRARPALPGCNKGTGRSSRTPRGMGQQRVDGMVEQVHRGLEQPFGGARVGHQRGS